MNEEWRQTHHPAYEVSNLGRVRSWAKRSPWHYAVTKPHLLKPYVNPDGYLSTGIAHVTTLVHRLVAAAFLGPCPPGQQVMHRDDDRLNARADNLDYGTSLQNNRDCVARGRRRYLVGAANPHSKLTQVQILEIRQRAQTERASILAAEFGVHQVTISKILRRKLWSHV